MPNLDWSKVKSTGEEELDWSKVKPAKIKPKLAWDKVEKLDWSKVEEPTSADSDLIQVLPIQDIARISSVIPPSSEINQIYLEPSAQLAISSATPFAKVMEEPAWRLTEGMFRLAKEHLKVFDRIIPEKYLEEGREKTFGWLNKMINYYGKPEEHAFFSSVIGEARKTYRADAAQKGTANLILNDLNTAATDLAGLLAQISLMNAVAPISASTPLAAVGKHLSRMGMHGFLTSPGTLEERAKAATYRIGYNITPYLANATGATGLAAVTTDALLNMFLTSPTYKRAYEEAGGLNKEFLVMSLPQFVMDLGMAVSTRGLPENIMRQKIKKYQKGRIKSLGMPEGELNRFIEGIQEKVELDSGKPHEETVKRIVNKTVSKYPQKVTDQKSLEDLGNKVAQDMGITEPIKWVFGYSKKTGVFGLWQPHKDEPSVIRIRIGQKRFTEQMVERTAKSMVGTNVRGVKLISPEQTKKFLRQDWSVSQGKIKNIIVHELVHALPDVRKQRVQGVMHPPTYLAFDKRVVAERERVFIETKKMERPVDTAEKIEMGKETGRKVGGPTTPPPKLPPPTDLSPGFRPDGGHPTRWQLSDPSNIRRVANELYKVIDVQARFKAVNAPETGFNVKNYFSMRSTLESLAHHIVKKMSTTLKLTPSEYADVTYYAAQPKLMKKLNKDTYPKFSEAVYQTNAAFLKIERMLKEARVIVDPWPQSQIYRMQEDILHHKQVVLNAERSDMPPQLKAFRIEKLKNEIAEAEGAINFLKEEDIQYVHIPTRLWLAKLMKEDPDRARTVMNRHFKERTTVDIRELAERLKADGIIKDEDIDIRNIIAAYYQQAGHKLALSNIINAAEKEGLIVDADATKGVNWPRFNPRWAPELRGKKVHPTFEQFINEFTLKTADIPLHRVLSYFKMTHFDSPLFMPFYDLYQAFWLGSTRSLKTPIYIYRACKSMMQKDKDYIGLSENGLFSRPFVAPFEDFMKSIEVAKAGNNFIRQTTAFLRGEWRGG